MSRKSELKCRVKSKWAFRQSLGDAFAARVNMLYVRGFSRRPLRWVYLFCKAAMRIAKSLSFSLSFFICQLKEQFSTKSKYKMFFTAGLSSDISILVFFRNSYDSGIIYRHRSEFNVV